MSNIQLTINKFRSVYQLDKVMFFLRPLSITEEYKLSNTDEWQHIAKTLVRQPCFSLRSHSFRNSKSIECLENNYGGQPFNYPACE